MPGMKISFTPVPSRLAPPNEEGGRPIPPIDMRAVNGERTRRAGTADKRLVYRRAIEVGAPNRIRTIVSPVDIRLVNRDIAGGAGAGDKTRVHRRTVEIGAADRGPTSGAPVRPIDIRAARGRGGRGGPGRGNRGTGGRPAAGGQPKRRNHENAEACHPFHP